MRCATQCTYSACTHKCTRTSVHAHARTHACTHARTTYLMRKEVSSRHVSNRCGPNHCCYSIVRSTNNMLGNCCACTSASSQHGQVLCSEETVPHTGASKEQDERNCVVIACACVFAGVVVRVRVLVEWRAKGGVFFQWGWVGGVWLHTSLPYSAVHSNTKYAFYLCLIFQLPSPHPHDGHCHRQGKGKG